MRKKEEQYLSHHSNVREESQIVVPCDKQEMKKEMGALCHLFQAYREEERKPGLGQWESASDALMERIRSEKKSSLKDVRNYLDASDSRLHKTLVILGTALAAALALGASWLLIDYLTGATHQALQPACMLPFIPAASWRRLLSKEKSPADSQ